MPRETGGPRRPPARHAVPAPPRAPAARTSRAPGPSRAPSTRCSSSHVSTSAGRGGEVAPVVLERAHDLDLPRAVERRRVAERWGRCRLRPADPHTSSAHGPSPNVTRTRTPPSTGSASTRRRAPLNGSHSSGVPDTPDTTTSSAPAALEAVEPVAQPCVHECQSSGSPAISISVARGYTAGTNSTAASPSRRSSVGTGARTVAGTVVERGGERRRGRRTCTAAPAAKRRRNSARTARRPPRARPPAPAAGRPRSRSRRRRRTRSGAAAVACSSTSQPGSTTTE